MWAMFTFTPCVGIQYCAYLAKLDNFIEYALLRDDVVIGIKEVAKFYKQVIKDLEVEISKAKIHEGNTLCEFAKNL